LRLDEIIRAPESVCRENELKIKLQDTLRVRGLTDKGKSAK
jgi:hypothetical protein